MTIQLLAGDQADLGQDVPNRVIGTLYKSAKGSTKDLYGRKWYCLEREYHFP